MSDDIYPLKHVFGNYFPGASTASYTWKAQAMKPNNAKTEGPKKEFLGDYVKLKWRTYEETSDRVKESYPTSKDYYEHLGLYGPNVWVSGKTWYSSIIFDPGAYIKGHLYYIKDRKWVDTNIFVGMLTILLEEEKTRQSPPKNNNGLTHCYICAKPTRKLLMLDTYSDYCDDCDA